MLKNARFLLLFSFCLLFSCASSDSFVNYRTPEGQLPTNYFSEKPSIYYQSDDQISIKIFNNEKFIDLFLETNSPATLRKIYNLGLSIWFDPDGKSKNIFAVNYPLPTDRPFTRNQFKFYLNKFTRIEFQEELNDRFKHFEIIDTRLNERLNLTNLDNNEGYIINLMTSHQILFSYHLHFPIKNIFPKSVSDKTIFSIGIASINEANEEYYSALSSKEVIRRKMGKLKAGSNQNPFELDEWWVNFQLAGSPQKFK
ncbi:hypothetical protein [Ancylomarina longa]|uniref:Lipoprotein n=1 Tax=Ancylomarina longa TaxID=2487017 RepID=A0A434AGA5_9BACT|nr:hypothetical protein [Ancylomarina longa]RUT73413.1 hypothetical protein DLK05_13675 [Ancylomarina longa]